MKKRYLSISLCLHLALLFFVAASEPKIAETPFEVELVESGNSAQKGRDVEVIEISEGPGEQKELAHYWGLGITGMYIAAPGGYVYQITGIYSGYNGEKIGLQVDDYIILVNGASPMQNDISGDGPATLKLIVKRGQRLIEISTERGKVYY